MHTYTHKRSLSLFLSSYLFMCLLMCAVFSLSRWWWCCAFCEFSSVYHTSHINNHWKCFIKWWTIFQLINCAVRVQLITMKGFSHKIIQTKCASEVATAPTAARCGALSKLLNHVLISFKTKVFPCKTITMTRIRKNVQFMLNLSFLPLIRWKFSLFFTPIQMGWKHILTIQWYGVCIHSRRRRANIISTGSCLLDENLTMTNKQTSLKQQQPSK